jgi:transposase InsO family protein
MPLKASLAQSASPTSQTRGHYKRVYRIYASEGLSIRKRKKTKRIGVRVPLVATLAVNQTWSMDFVSDAIARPGAVSRRIKCLTVADDYSHECVDITADFGIGGAYVTRLLDRAAMFRGYPKEVRTDNGPEFTCRAFMTWAQKHSIKHILIEPGSPTARPKTRTSRVSTEHSEMNVWMRTGLNRWSKPDRPSPHGEPTTTRSDPTVAAGVYPPASQ